MPARREGARAASARGVRAPWRRRWQGYRCRPRRARMRPPGAQRCGATHSACEVWRSRAQAARVQSARCPPHRSSPPSPTTPAPPPARAMCACVRPRPAHQGSAKRRRAQRCAQRAARERQDAPRRPAQKPTARCGACGERRTHQLLTCARVLPLGRAGEQAAQLLLACGSAAAVMGLRTQAGGGAERPADMWRARAPHRSSSGGHPSACTGAARPRPEAPRSCGARARAGVRLHAQRAC